MTDSYINTESLLKSIGEDSFLTNMQDVLESSTGGFGHLYMPLTSEKDNIFREVLATIPNEYRTRVNAFFSVLAGVYSEKRNPDIQYIPIRLTESDDNSLIYDWVFENVRFMFIFNKDGNDSCSIVFFIQSEGRLISTIIPLDIKKYDTIAEEIMSYIS